MGYALHLRLTIYVDPPTKKSGENSDNYERFNQHFYTIVTAGAVHDY
jgi:hypothetical protein